jgi:ribosomal protein L16/L10AE
MGKGKGAFLRWAIIVNFNVALFEFKNINKILILKFLKKLNIITGNKLCFISKKNLF